MFTFLFKLAAIVMFVFTLIASLHAGTEWLNETWLTWGSSGFLAGFFALFFAPWFDAQFKAAQARTKKAEA